MYSTDYGVDCCKISLITHSLYILAQISIREKLYILATPSYTKTQLANYKLLG